MLIIAEPARTDLKEIWSYIAEINISAAERLIKELSAKFDLLENNPTLGRSRDEFILNLRSFPHKSYIIFYFLLQDGIEIYRVVHSSRHIEQIFNDFFEGLDE